MSIVLPPDGYSSAPSYRQASAHTHIHVEIERGGIGRYTVCCRIIFVKDNVIDRQLIFCITQRLPHTYSLNRFWTNISGDTLSWIDDCYCYCYWADHTDAYWKTQNIHQYTILCIHLFSVLVLSDLFRIISMDANENYWFANVYLTFDIWSCVWRNFERKLKLY